jgi:hypothetical protein
MKRISKIMSVALIILLMLALTACAPNASNADQNTKTAFITIDFTKAVDAGYKTDVKDGFVAKEVEVKFGEGQSAYDILEKYAKDNNIIFSKKDMGGFIYIDSIASLTEKDMGAMSGWLYNVNGEYLNVSCSEYKVNEGDKITFIYSIDGGSDIGAW